MMTEITVGTDFSGVGAPEEALKELGVDHRVLFACEKDKYARQTYQANHSAEIMYDDVTTRDNSTAPAVDLYCFGFPCQAFSMSGQRKGFDDIRGTLFFNSAEYIKEKRPRVFIAENVKGLLSHDKPKGSKSKHGRTFSTIINILAKTINGQILMPMYEDNLGYNVFYTVLNSKHYDVPQNRERVFIVGFRDDVQFSFPFSNKITKKLIDVIEEKVDDKYFLSETMIKWLNSHSDKKKDQGCGFKFEIADMNGVAAAVNARQFKMGIDDTYIDDDLIMISKEVRTDRAKQLRKQTGTHPFRSKEIIFEPADIANTIQTNFTNDNIIITKKRIRRLTPLECMRLQGFPDDFLKPCSDTQIYKQAGNSMSVPVIKAIIKNILTSLKNQYIC